MTRRELDKLVAEKVMNLVPCDKWRPVNLGSAGGPAMMVEQEGHEHAPGQCYPARDYSGQDSGCPHYSTNLQRAWEIIEKLRPEYCCITIYSDHDYCWRVSLTPAQDYAHLEKPYGHTPVAVVDGEESLPLAICLAALEAKGVKVRDVEG